MTVPVQNGQTWLSHLPLSNWTIQKIQKEIMQFGVGVRKVECKMQHWILAGMERHTDLLLPLSWESQEAIFVLS